MRKKVFIIAEAGVNHNGSLLIAKKMIDEAASAGADAIKFQTFEAWSMVSRYAPKAPYQKIDNNDIESQFNMLQKLQLDINAHRELISRCKSKKIIFLSSPFDLGSIDLLADFDLKIFKVPSGEITDLPYLRKIGSLNKKIILSTGMSTMPEIGKALDVLVTSGTKKINITTLHCNSGYPTPFEDANLAILGVLRRRFKTDVGYSDHTLGIEASIAAVALAATVIEKHFTLDRSMEGPDHKISLEPDRLAEMVMAIRNVELAVGNCVAKPTKSESKNRCIVRKSIVASCDIKKGEVFTGRNITTKRPATGLSPLKWDRIIGRIAKKDFRADEQIII